MNSNDIHEKNLSFCFNHRIHTFSLSILLVAGAIFAPEEEHMSYAAVLCSYLCNNYSEFLRVQNGLLEPFYSTTC